MIHLKDYYVFKSRKEYRTQYYNEGSFLSYYNKVFLFNIDEINKLKDKNNNIINYLSSVLNALYIDDIDTKNFMSEEKYFFLPYKNFISAEESKIIRICNKNGIDINFIRAGMVYSVAFSESTMAIDIDQDSFIDDLLWIKNINYNNCLNDKINNNYQVKDRLFKWMKEQLNSEHCRHHLFNSLRTIDGVSQISMFDRIKSTFQDVHKDSILSAYKDNAACVGSHSISNFFPDESNIYKELEDNISITLKVETHNHPTAISPYPGAATGIGGRLEMELRLVEEGPACLDLAVILLLTLISLMSHGKRL